MQNNLASKKCVPCEGGVSPLPEERIQELLKEIPGWELVDSKLTRQFKFGNFIGSINFVNELAEIAEEEGHHPDIHIFYQRAVSEPRSSAYNKVKLELMTHAAKGLTENDFILAAKINELKP